jgi:hypothetical protein
MVLPWVWRGKEWVEITLQYVREGSWEAHKHQNCGFVETQQRNNVLCVACKVMGTILLRKLVDKGNK